MIKAIAAILQALVAIVRMIAGAARKAKENRRERRHDKQTKAIEESPSEWFGAHFGERDASASSGVGDILDDGPDGGVRGSADTPKADPDSDTPR